MSRPGSLFRTSIYDVIPTLCVFGIVALIFWTFLSFQTLSWWILIPAFIVLAWSYCWNMQCLSHNFIHNPFFHVKMLNRLFSVIETLRSAFRMFSIIIII